MHENRPTDVLCTDVIINVFARVFVYHPCCCHSFDVDTPPKKTIYLNDEGVCLSCVFIFCKMYMNMCKCV